ncbi:MFS transporter [Actinocatenispora thailandica]|uniref:MFS transporter n=1 Tax=Actinocatenispora thailandica TaxID=227318 RepID=A0A7R7HW43_9ACTN|nr:MFS transporter [Actinocatenispora thailandica]BCJ33574.1 MFS transporter [Actinocatenispora thailandica]
MTRGGGGALTAAMGLCVSLVVGMVSALNLGIPLLSASALHPSAGSVVWVVDGYVAVFACLLVPAGALADRLGRKGTLLAGLSVFGLGSALCALAPATGVLIGGRMLSGVGAAAVLPSTLALLLSGGSEPADPPGAAGRRRGRRIAAWSSMTGLAAVLGNVGGGAALQTGSWRVPFAAAVPLTAVAVAATALAAPRVPRHPGRLDPAGAALLTAGVLALLFAVIAAPRYGWLGAPVVVAGTLSVLLLAGWVVHGCRARTPLLDPRILAAPAVRAGALGMALTFAGMFAVMYLNGQFLQYVRGFSVLGSGLRLLPMAAALYLAPRGGAAVARRYGRRAGAGAGLLVLAAGLAVVGTLDAHTGYPGYVSGVVLVAAGCGLAGPVLSEVLVTALPASGAGTGSGLQSLARELGSAIGVAVAGSLTAAGFDARLPAGVGDPGTVPAALAAGADRVTVLDAFTGSAGNALRAVAVAVAVLGLLVVRWLPGRRPAGQNAHTGTGGGG